MDAGEQTPLPQPLSSSSPFPFAGWWFDSVKMTDDHNRAMLDWCQTVWSPQAVRKRWLEALTEVTDVYLRSPAFLEATRLGMANSAELQALQDRLVRDAVRRCGLPSAGDIDALAERVRRAERELTARLDEIEDRLDQLSPKHNGDTGN